MPPRRGSIRSPVPGIAFPRPSLGESHPIAELDVTVASIAMDTVTG